jgi:hypothetical protein
MKRKDASEHFSYNIEGSKGEGFLPYNCFIFDICMVNGS